MSDLISRQAAIDAMCELMHHWFGGDPKDEVREIKRELEKLPAVQSQPEIIRCKECKEFRRYIDTDITFCDRTECERKPDDFCSMAERRTDG